MLVLVTGGNGQLGKSLQFIAKNYPEIDFKFCDSKTLDITNKENVERVFENYKPDFCINTAAYTAVDKAESEPEKAAEINVIGSRNLAQASKIFNTVLIHISTDFVFDGLATIPYSETDLPNPKGIYGQTKLAGEKAIQETWQKHYIIRTSWVYSQFGNNFLKTMLRFGQDRDSISVVNDQFGTPTNAVDLAEVLVKIVAANYNQKTENFGIYNFSNQGFCSWFDFAKAIFDNNNIKIDLKPILTSSYPTPAERPKYSVLDKSKIINTFQIEIKTWQESIKSVTL